jgi:hypothetical protein
MGEYFVAGEAVAADDCERVSGSTAELLDGEGEKGV